MKNTAGIRAQRHTKDHNSIRAGTASVLLVCALFVFGCDGSLQTGFSDNAGVEYLVPEAMEIIQEGLADGNPRVRAGAIEVVVATRQVRFMPEVQRLLKDEFVPVRFLAALAVGEMEYQLAKSDVARLLKDQQDVRVSAAYAMSKLGSPDSLELVRKAISSENQRARANAVLLLGKSGDKSALELLHWAMRDKNSDDKVRLQAAEAIARLGDERIYPRLWAMLISAYADDRVMGVRAMGALGTPQAQNALITMLDDDVLEVRLVAAEQLGMLGSSTGEPEVLDVFEKNLLAELNEEGVERVNVLTALAIGEIGTPAVKKFLPQMLDNESKFVRLAAARAVLSAYERVKP